MATETFTRLKQEKQDKITRCATEAFAANGYTGTSMDAIAEAAGVAKGALYRYFSSKKDLYMHVVDELRDDARQFAIEYLASRREFNVFDTIRDWLVSIYTLQERFDTHRRLLCNILYEEAVDFKGEVLAKFDKLTTHYIQLLLQQGIARGEVREDVDLNAAAFIVQLVQDRFHDGVTVPFLDMGYSLYHQPQAVIDHKADKIVDIFRRAFGKPETVRRENSSGKQNDRSSSA